AHLGDDAGQFMTERDGRLQHHCVVATPVDLEVGPACQRSAYADYNLPSRCPGCRHALQTQIFLAVQYRRRHLRNHPYYLLILRGTFLCPYSEADQRDPISSSTPASDTLSHRHDMPFVSPEDFAKQKVAAIQEYSILSWRAIANFFSRPRYMADVFTQMDSIGVGSMPI